MKTPSARAFTLIELLVVAGVIALLGTLLLPAIARTKHSARQVQCVSNLRQLATACRLYWDDHDGKPFLYRGAFTNGGDIFWFGWLERGAEGGRKFDARAGVLFPYLQGRGVEVCPSLNHLDARFKLKATGAAYGYGYNLHLAPSSISSTGNIDRLARADQTVLLADAGQVNTFQAPASPDRPMLEEFYYVSRFEATAHFRHRRRANAVFCDGHVAGEKPQPHSLDERLPALAVGRLRDEVFGVP